MADASVGAVIEPEGKLVAGILEGVKLTALVQSDWPIDLMRQGRDDGRVPMSGVY